MEQHVQFSRYLSVYNLVGKEILVDLKGFLLALLGKEPNDEQA